MSGANTISLAVWDASMPVVAGEPFAIRVGARAADARSLAGCRIAVSDASGAEVASGRLGEKPWPGTEALYWAELSVPAPPAPQVAAFQARLLDAPAHAEPVATAFCVVAADKPEHGVTLRVTDRDTTKPLANVEVRLGPFHARTDANGSAALRVAQGDYQVKLWRTAYIAAPQALTVERDTTLDLTMQNVPEEHPDARWVR